MGFLGFIILFNYFDLAQLLTLETFKQYQASLHLLYSQSQIQFILIFGLAYTLLITLTCPGAILFMLGGGAIFGPLLATIIIAIFGSIGAVFSMYASRFLFKEWVEDKFSKWIIPFNREINKNPFLTITLLRLIPVFPFFGINIMAGITKTPVSHFFWGTFFGMIPTVYIHAVAGLQISQIMKISDIFNLKITLLLCLMLSLSILGLVLKSKLIKSHEIHN